MTPEDMRRELRRKLDERKKTRITLAPGAKEAPGVVLTPEYRAYYLLVAAGQLVAPGVSMGMLLDYHVDWGFNSYLIPAIIWSIVVITSEMWKEVFFTVLENRGAIIFNPLLSFKRLRTYEEEPDPDTKRGLREAGHGLQGKWFFERIAKIINLTVDVSFPPAEISGKCSDNIMAKATVQVSSRPLRGALVNSFINSRQLVQQTSESDIDLAGTELFACYRALPSADGPGILELANEFRDDLNGLVYGGDGVVDPTEVRLGSYFGKLLVKDLRLPEDIMRIIEATKRGEIVVDLFDKLVKAGVPKEQAAIIAGHLQGLSLSGLEHRTWKFEGLENLPAGLKHASFGGTDIMDALKGSKPEGGKKGGK